jgi:hypothetical protein
MSGVSVQVRNPESCHPTPVLLKEKIDELNPYFVN